MCKKKEAANYIQLGISLKSRTAVEHCMRHLSGKMTCLFIFLCFLDRSAGFHLLIHPHSRTQPEVASVLGVLLIVVAEVHIGTEASVQK